MFEKRDLVVVGGGAMGSATAWEAARRGYSVTLLERFEAGHTVGASHGATRNFNQAYSATEYLRLVTEADHLWGELGDETGMALIDRVGLLNHGFAPALLETQLQLAAHNIPHEMVGVREAGERWPQFRFRTDVLHLPRSGRVRAADALIAFRHSAEVRGAEFRYGEPAMQIRIDSADQVTVVTADRVYQAKNVVVTAGAWTEKLLSEFIHLPRLRVTQEQPAHFRPRDDSPWPSFNHRPDPEQLDDDYWLSPVYGMLTPGEGIKAGWHGVGPETDPDRRSFEAVPDQLALLQRYAEEWLPGVDPSDPVPISCTYTSTDSEDFVLERTGPVVVGAGFSGQGFKFTPAIGRILVDLVEGIQSPAMFRPGISLKSPEATMTS